MDHNYQIAYENIYLRPLSQEDIECLRNWRNNTNNTEYLSKIPYITPAMQSNWFKEYLENDDEMCFAIVERQELKRLVGSLSLYNFKDESCLFGKILIGDNDAHGRKVGINATVAAIKIAFETLRLKKIVLYVYVDNKRAIKVYRNAGFLICGEHITTDERREYIMSIEREEAKCIT